MSFRAQLERSDLVAFCRRWRISELSVFGSAKRGELREDSDVDLLVSFEQGAAPSLFELSRLARELSELLGREVDVLTRRGVEQSRNPYRRREILETAETIYAT